MSNKNKDAAIGIFFLLFFGAAAVWGIITVIKDLPEIISGLFTWFKIIVIIGAVLGILAIINQLFKK